MKSFWIFWIILSTYLLAGGYYCLNNLLSAKSIWTERGCSSRITWLAYDFINDRAAIILLPEKVLFAKKYRANRIYLLKCFCFYLHFIFLSLNLCWIMFLCASCSYFLCYKHSYLSAWIASLPVMLFCELIFNYHGLHIFFLCHST